MIKLLIVKAMIFLVVVYECDNWTIKKAEHQKLILSTCSAMENSWESLDSKEIKPVNPKVNQYLIFIRRTDAEAEAPILCHLMWRVDSLEKTLMLAKIEGRRRRGQQRVRWLDGITTQWIWVWVNSGNWWRTGKPGMGQCMGSQKDTTELLNN